MIVGDLDIVRDNLVLHVNTINKRCYDRLSNYVVNLANESENGTIVNFASFNTTDGSINLNEITNDYITFNNASFPSCTLTITGSGPESIYNGYDAGGTTTVYIKQLNPTPITLATFDITLDPISSFYTQIASQINANTGTTGYFCYYNGTDIKLYQPNNGADVIMEYANSNSIDYGGVQWVLFDGSPYSFINAYTPGSGFNPNGLQEYSFSTWFKNNNSTGGLISWYRVPEYSDFGFELELFSGVLYFAFSSGIYATYAYPTTGQWVNIAVTYNGLNSGNSNRLKIYINGEQVTLSYVGTIPSSIDANTDTLDIGLIQAGTGDRFIDGNFGHLLSYTSTLTPEEVRQNYNATKNWFL